MRSGWSGLRGIYIYIPQVPFTDLLDAAKSVVRALSRRSTWPCRCRASALHPPVPAAAGRSPGDTHLRAGPDTPVSAGGTPIPVLLRVPWHPSWAGVPRNLSLPPPFPASWHAGVGRQGQELSCWGLWAGKQVAWKSSGLATPSSPLQMPRCTHGVLEQHYRHGPSTMPGDLGLGLRMVRAWFMCGHPQGTQ